MIDSFWRCFQTNQEQLMALVYTWYWSEFWVYFVCKADLFLKLESVLKLKSFKPADHWKLNVNLSIKNILECVAPYKHHEHDLFIFKHFTYHGAHSQERVYTSWCMTRSQPAETAHMHTFRDFFAGGEGKEERQIKCIQKKVMGTL